MSLERPNYYNSNFHRVVGLDESFIHFKKQADEVVFEDDLIALQMAEVETETQRVAKVRDAIAIHFGNAHYSMSA